MVPSFFQRFPLPRHLTLLILALAIASGLLASCKSRQKEEPAPSLSKTQRDSLLSESPVPGASTVKSALAVSDSARARAERVNRAAEGGYD